MPSSNGRILRRGSETFALRCEVDILPAVWESDNSVMPTLTGPQQQKLSCREGLGNFASCPHLRHPNLTVGQVEPEGMEPLGAPRCRLFEVCDQAVLIHSGWNQLTSRQADHHLLRENYRLLRDSGFPSTNIRTFFANGIQDPDGKFPISSVLAWRLRPKFLSVFVLGLLATTTFHSSFFLTPLLIAFRLSPFP